MRVVIVLPHCQSIKKLRGSIYCDDSKIETGSLIPGQYRKIGALWVLIRETSNWRGRAPLMCGNKNDDNVYLGLE